VTGRQIHVPLCRTQEQLLPFNERGKLLLHAALARDKIGLAS